MYLIPCAGGIKDLKYRGGWIGHTHTHARTHARTHTHMYIYIYIHIFVYIYIHIWTTAMLSHQIPTLATKFQENTIVNQEM